MIIRKHLNMFLEIDQIYNVPIGPLRLSPLGWICESVKLQIRKCEGAKAKVQRPKSEDATAKEQYYYRSFAFASSHFHLHPFYCIQQVSVDWYMTFDAETVLAQGLSIYLRYYSYACVRPSCFLRMFINSLLCNMTYMFTSDGYV